MTWRPRSRSSTDSGPSTGPTTTPATYKSPTVVGLYDGTDEENTPTCDGEPLESYNAFYCASEDYVAWDASLLVNGADQIGDSWVYLVVAHEWGHAIQARLEDDLVATAEELQADCLGAAAMYGAVADKTLELEPGDDAGADRVADHAGRSDALDDGVRPR